MPPHTHLAPPCRRRVAMQHHRRPPARPQLQPAPLLRPHLGDRLSCKHTAADSSRPSLSTAAPPSAAVTGPPPAPNAGPPLSLHLDDDELRLDPPNRRPLALVDAPDIVGCQMNLKHLSSTDINIYIKRVSKNSTLIKAMEKAAVKNKWEYSSRGRKLIVQKRRA